MHIQLNLLILLFAGAEVLAQHESHLHPELILNDYTGPINEEMTSMFAPYEVIKFENCNITSMSSNFVSKLPKLRKLSSINVTFDLIRIEPIEGETKLEESDFIGSFWLGANVEAWNILKHLKRLVISHPKVPFTELKANSLNETKLRHLQISFSGVEKIDDLAFNNLHELETLILSDNKLKTLSNEIFKPLKSLQKLDLHGNLLESFDISQLPELPKLEGINLSKNPLKTLTIDGMDKNLPNLRVLEISRTALTEEQLDNLRKNNKILLQIQKKIEVIIAP